MPRFGSSGNLGLRTIVTAELDTPHHFEVAANLGGRTEIWFGFSSQTGLDMWAIVWGLITLISLWRDHAGRNAVKGRWTTTL